jgi:uncharacterized LabA/DUF88 family protein
MRFVKYPVIRQGKTPIRGLFGPGMLSLGLLLLSIKITSAHREVNRRTDRSIKPMSCRPRTIVYVDGFNLYFGIRSKGWRHLYWLNIGTLAASITRPPNELVATRYFSAHINGPKKKRQRQLAFLEANKALKTCSMSFGTYRSHPRRCRRCGDISQEHTEKKTDINIAVAILTDAFQDAFDTAILVSGDADLVPAVDAVHSLFPAKKLIVGFPPERFSRELDAAASSSFRITKQSLSKSQLPETVEARPDYVIRRPDRWTRSSAAESRAQRHRNTENDTGGHQ